MRLIDVDKISNVDISLALGVGSASSLSDIRDLLDEQPTVKPQCIATINVDFTKEDINRLVEQKVKGSIMAGWNLDRLKELLMEYACIKVKNFLYGGNDAICGNILDKETIDDIIRFIRERENTHV